VEENINIEISETNWGKEQIIINKKYKSNFSFKKKKKKKKKKKNKQFIKKKKKKKKKKDNSKIYNCTEYKIINKWKSIIIINVKKGILKYESLHNHLEKEFDT